MMSYKQAAPLLFVCSAPMPEDRLRELLAAAPGVRIMDDRKANRFPEPRDASGNDYYIGDQNSEYV